MGVLSVYIKPSFLGLLKFINSMHWLIVFFSLINLSVCIYEDQIGKFDWRQTYVGKIKFSQFDTISTAKKIIVATEENVLAALNLKTGQVVWRHVLESTSSGNIQMLHVSDKVVTVSGNNPFLVRGWEPATGVLLYEWSLTVQKEEMAEFSEWWVKQGMLVHMIPVYGSHIEVTMYNVVTGHNSGATSKMPAVWTNEGCILTPPYYTCLSESRLLISLDVTSNAVQIISKPVTSFIETSNDIFIRPLDANSAIPGFILDEKKIILIMNNAFKVLNSIVADDGASLTIVDSSDGPLLMQMWNDESKGFSLIAHTIEGDEVPALRCQDKSHIVHEPVLSAVTCSKREHVCRILITTVDESAIMVQQGGKVMWSREEALANVVAAEFVDLPVSDLDAAIESEFDQKDDSIWAAFTRRIHTQYQQLWALTHSHLGPKPGPHAAGAADVTEPLVRDYFNLHKIIVMVTDVGKIFGIDNLSGEILWSRFEPALRTDGVALLQRRASRHPPFEACVTVVGKHEDTGNGLLISLNPVQGTLTAEHILHLDTKLLQAAVLPQADSERMHGLVLLEQDESVQVFPKSAAPLVLNMFMYVAQPDTAQVRGYALAYDGRQVVAEKIWSINLGGSPAAGHRIVAAAGKPAAARAHSHGRVLGDRSVLYKYINPNLLLFVTEGPDALHKDIVVATCVDGVSGAVVTSHAHRRARALPLAVHSENFMAYLYYSDKHRRVEIATMELYEGKQRWLPAGAAFSSLASERAPAAQRQSYVLAAAPTAVAVTTTERALTDRHVILGLSSGALAELPWALLEPRRPAAPSPAEREEGLLPYAPELPLQPEAVINYNRTLHRINAIYTAPSGLESTSLVLATGLDMFYTRVAPSKTFDLLKDDFDYYLITIVLAGLIAATYGTKYFASRKMLKQAWK